MSSNIHFVRNNFTGGETSPLLEGRVDSSAVQTGCKLLENFILRPYGGISRRPGTEFIADADSTSERLVPFKRSRDINNIIEVADNKMKFWTNGENPYSVSRPQSGVTLWSATTGYNVNDFARIQNVGDITYPQTVYICTSSHNVTSPHPSANNIVWRATDTSGPIQGYSTPETTFNFINGVDGDILDIAISNGIVGHNYTFEYDNNATLSDPSYSALPVGNALSTIHTILTGFGVDATLQSPSALVIRGYPMEASSVYIYVWDYLIQSKWEGNAIALPFRNFDYEIWTPLSGNNITNFNYVQLNDIMFFAHEEMYPQRLSRIAEDDWRLENVPFDYAPQLDINETTTQIQIQYDVPQWSTSDWASGETYLVGDTITLSATPFYFYEAKTEHASTTANKPTTGPSWTTDWQLYTYSVGDRVVNDYGQVYTCSVAHTAVNTAASPYGQPGISTGAWINVWNPGTESAIVADWVNGHVYNSGDKVKRGTVIYTCISKHKATAETIVGRYAGTVLFTKGGNIPGTSSAWTSYWRITGSENDATDLKFKLVSTNDIFQESDENTIWQLKIGIPNYYTMLALDANTDLGPSDSLFVQGAYLVTTSWDTNTAMIGTVVLEESNDGVSWSPVKEWVTTRNNEGNINYSGETSTKGSWFRFRGKRISGGQRHIKLERTNSIATIPFKVSEYVSAKEVRGLMVLDNNQLPPPQAIGVSTKLWSKPAFSTVAGYPRAVSFFENRLWWAGTPTQQGRIWASHVDDYYTYLLGVEDTDGIDQVLAATETNAINWIKPFNKSLVIGTAGELWTVDAGDGEKALTPTTIRARLRMRYGTAQIEPQVTGESLLWIQNSKKTVREFAYRYELDAFSAPDMTLLAQHITKSGIRYTAFQNNPEPILWSITEDGELIGLTYNREQNIIGWHRHITGLRDDRYSTFNTMNGEFTGVDKFKALAVVYGDKGTDEIWFIVDRRGYKSIERFNPELYAQILGHPFDQTNVDDLAGYMDCHIHGVLTNNSPGSSTGYINSTTLASPLIGRQCQWSQSGMLRNSGTNVYYTLDNVDLMYCGDIPMTTEMNSLTGKTFLFGLPYMSVCVPGRIDIPLDNGTSLARKTRINRLAFIMSESKNGGLQYLDGSINSLSAQTIFNFEKKPLFTDSVESISYDGFVFSPNGNAVAPSSAYDRGYTGQTTDLHFNSNHGPVVNFAIVQKTPDPLSVLAIVYKMEINGQ